MRRGWRKNKLKNIKSIYKMPFFHFPSEFVYWEQVNNHEKIKSELAQKSYNIPNDLKR